MKERKTLLIVVCLLLVFLTPGGLFSATFPFHKIRGISIGEGTEGLFTGGCGEYEFSLVFAALQNPAVSNATRAAVEDIMVADANNNITLKEAETIAANLNNYRTSYVKKFKKPQNIDDKICASIGSNIPLPPPPVT